LLNKVHPDVVLDDVDQGIDEPNFNNFNPSPDPPSPYADLEKKYRKNRFNKSRNSSSSDGVGKSASKSHPLSNASGGGNKVHKRKSKKKPPAKSARYAPGKRNA